MSFLLVVVSHLLDHLEKPSLSKKSNDVTGSNDTEVTLQFNPGSVTMDNENEMRNFELHSSG